MRGGGSAGREGYCTTRQATAQQARLLHNRQTTEHEVSIIDMLHTRRNTAH